MKVLTFNNREEWLEARKGKITGSRLKDVITKRGTGWKKGVFEVIAERIKQDTEEEDPMERGHRLEEEAVQRFEKESGKAVDTSLVIWTREDEESIALSPDGFIGEKEAVEVKCLNCASHIEAWVLQKVPSEYEDQMIQYFIVNDKLETLYFCFYDPRIPAKDFFYLTINREDVAEKVEEYLTYQKELLAAINKIVNDLTF